jgi:serine/threonine-protein kinase
MRKTLIAGVAAAVVTAVTLVASATGAWALNGGPWTWQNHATLLCLDSNSSGNVYTLGCNGGNFQLWIDSQNSLGDQIKNYQTGRCLDSNTSGSVYTLPCNGGTFQRWIVTSTSRGFQIKDTATSLCLDSNANGNVYTLACNGGNFQRWD